MQSQVRAIELRFDKVWETSEQKSQFTDGAGGAHICCDNRRISMESLALNSSPDFIDVRLQLWRVINRVVGCRADRGSAPAAREPPPRFENSVLHQHPDNALAFAHDSFKQARSDASASSI